MNHLKLYAAAKKNCLQKRLEPKDIRKKKQCFIKMLNFALNYDLFAVYLTASIIKVSFFINVYHSADGIYSKIAT